MNRPARSPHYRAFCYGLLLLGRSFGLQGVSIATEHVTVSKLYDFAIRDAIGARAVLSQQQAPRRAALYTVELTDPTARARLLECFEHSEGHPCRALMEEDCFPMFFCGAFMACGTVNEPAKGYHLELVPPSDALADLLFEQLVRAGYPPKSTGRRNQTVLYFKESEQIEDLLTLIGATRSSLALMETKIYRDLRNRANRAANCDTANADKLLRAADRQLQSIALLRARKRLETLPAPILEIALLREQNPEASLSELSSLTGLSRSAVNHRLRQLAQAVQQLREEER